MSTRFKSLIITTFSLICFNQAMAQNSLSTDVFSPFTMYGLGELRSGANIQQAAMGGAGIASFNSFEINYLNPASLGFIPQRSALLNFSGQVQNTFSSTNSTNEFGQSFHAKSVGNNVSLHDFAFAIPIARGIGFSASLQPISQVGYNSTVINDNADVYDNLGRVYYNYTGEGGISAVTTSVGARLSKGLSLGASMIYYFGAIDRHYTATMMPLIEPIYTRAVKAVESQEISQISGRFGLTYSARVSRTGRLAFGFTYQPKTTIHAKQLSAITTVDVNSMDTVSFVHSNTPIILPEKFGAGLFFADNKWQLAADYSYQNFTNAFNTDHKTTGVTLMPAHNANFGIAFTPNKGDIRSAMKRWTYRAGAYYNNSYMMVDGVKVNTVGITLGADVPLKTNRNSKMTVGLDYSWRGVNDARQIKEQIFKINIGFTLFGTDMWFEKRKFN